MKAWLDTGHTDNNSQGQEGSSHAKLSEQPGSPPLMWPYCMNPEVGSYKKYAHNLTNAETTYNVKLSIWFLLMDTIDVKSARLHYSSSAYPIFTKLAPGLQ